MLSSYSFEHFRAFLRPTKIELKPVTLFFGYNNSGKSGLLRGAVSLLKSLSGRPGVPWTNDQLLMRGASFAELCSSPLSSKTAYFSCGIELGSGRLRGASWTLRQEGLKVFVSDCRLKSETGNELHATVSGAIEPDKEFAYAYDIVGGSRKTTARIVFEGLRPRIPRAGNDALAAEFHTLSDALPTADRTVQWLGASRIAPPRQHRATANWSGALLPDGTGVLDFLVSENDSGRLGPVGSAVSKWYEANLKRRLRLDANGDRFDIRVEPFGEVASDLARASICLADAGEGLAQILPILVALERARQGGSYAPRFLCIEEPESHLHPRFHAALAEAFCMAASVENPPIILAETHSENLLLRVQLAVAKKEIPAESVAIYWIRQDDGGESRADLVTLDALGRPVGDWPPTIFGEDMRLSRELLAIQRSQEAQQA